MVFWAGYRLDPRSRWSWCCACFLVTPMAIRGNKITKRRSEDRKSPFFPEKVKVVLILVKILKKSDSTHSSSKGGVNAYFLTGSFFKKTVVFEAAIFVGQSEDGAEVRCEVSRRVETAVSRYSGPSALRFLRCPART